MKGRRSVAASCVEFPQQGNSESATDFDFSLLNFYKNFLKTNTKFTAEIITNEIVEEEGKSFVVYDIWIITSFLEYKISKRYSHFYSFREKLLQEYPALPFREIPFPEKRLFWNLNEEVRTSRQMILNKFLKELYPLCYEANVLIFFEFLDIRNRYYFEERKNQSEFSMQRLSEFAWSEGYDIIFDFLEKLNNDPLEMSKNLREFENFYNQKKPIVGEKLNKILFQGIGKVKGLISFCGKCDEETNSHLICNIGLPFLVNLMSYDFNNEAQSIRDIFGSCKMHEIKMLNLEQHINGKGQRGCKQSALQLVDFYLEKNMNLTVHDLLKSKFAIEEYEKWKYPRESNSRKSEKFKIIESLSPISPDLTQKNLMSMTNFEEIFFDSFDQTGSTNDTKILTPKKISDERIESLLDQLIEKPSPWIPVLTKDENICRIEHQNYTSVNMKIEIKRKPLDCVSYLIKSNWMLNQREKVLKQKVTRNSYECIDVYELTNHLNMKYITFYSEIQIFDENPEAIIISERDLAINKDYYTKIDGEIIGHRTVRVELKAKKNLRTKVKIFIKNNDQNSINFTKSEIFSLPEKLEESLYNLKHLIENEAD